MSISFVIVISLWYRNNFIANIYLILLSKAFLPQYFSIILQNNVKLMTNCQISQNYITFTSPYLSVAMQQFGRDYILVMSYLKITRLSHYSHHIDLHRQLTYSIHF